MSLFDSLPDIPQGIKDFGAEASASATKLVDKATDFAKNFDPASVRLEVSNLLTGGTRNPKSKSKAGGATPRFSSDIADWRVKVKLAESAKYFYKGPDAGILAPLINTDGVIFPYTPQVSVTHTARYASQQLTHSNYTNYAYEGSEVAAISITGDFTAQNSTEAAYVLACIHFFRSATKMWFGGTNLTGNPPPMLFLSGYGNSYFPNVPCVLTSFQHTMPQDVDYVQAMSSVTFNLPTSEKNKTVAVMPTLNTMVPTMSQIQITLQPIYSRKNISENFDLNEFAKGTLIGGYAGRGTGFI
jgi:hypothetical protein